MNFQSEKKKPLFAIRPTVLAANESLSIGLSIKMAAARAENTGDYLVKPAEARNVRSGVLVKVAELTRDEAKDLVVARLQAEPEARFEFMDGRVFSGSEAAREVRSQSDVGKYFLELEKEVIRINQQAYFEGKL